MKSLFITATGTDVGKSFVSAGIMKALLAKSIRASYYKPVESGAMKTDAGLVSGECAYVRELSGCDAVYNTYCFHQPVSPHLASRMEGRPIDKQSILRTFDDLMASYDFVLVEGAGGLAVPLIEHEYMLYDLIKELGTEIIIVADAGLGTINHTTLTIAMAKQWGIPIKGVILNRYKNHPVHAENARSIEALTGVSVLAKIPNMMNPSKDSIHDYFANVFPIEKLL